MNIFILDHDIGICARYHADQHVVKMVLEGTQILCTVLNKSDVPAPYRSTHENHPCVLWAGQSRANWLWLRRLVLYLNDEYRYRFEAPVDHRSAVIARTLPVPPIPDRGLTEFVQVMPPRYAVPGNPVRAYRKYYVGEKSVFARWTKRSKPEWFREALLSRGERCPSGDAGS